MIFGGSIEEWFEPGLEENVVFASLIVPRYAKEALNIRTLMLNVPSSNEMSLYMSRASTNLPYRSILLEMIKYSGLTVFNSEVTCRLIDVSTTKAMHTPINVLAKAKVECWNDGHVSRRLSGCIVYLLACYGGPPSVLRCLLHCYPVKELDSSFGELFKGCILSGRLKRWGSCSRWFFVQPIRRAADSVMGKYAVSWEKQK